MTMIGSQLSLDILPDQRAVPGSMMVGSLRVAGTFAVDQNLDRGQQLMIQISDADGQVITTALAMVSAVGFTNLYERDAVIGTERQHKAKLA